jgi:phospholipase C
MTDEMPVEREALPRGITHVPADDALSNLQKVEHIVVLMLENRSFDHMLEDLEFLRALRVCRLSSDLQEERRSQRRSAALFAAGSTKILARD